MSYELVVFHSRRPLTDDEASVLFLADRRSAIDCVTGPGSALVDFLGELGHRFPDIDDLTGVEASKSPWAAGFDVSETMVVLSVVHSRTSEIAPVIVNLAEKYGLICFDPQDGRIKAAPSGFRLERRERLLVDEAEMRERPEWPFVATLNEVLTPHRYVREGLVWRKDGRKAIVALRLWSLSGGYRIDLCALCKPWYTVWPFPGSATDTRDVFPGEGGKCDFWRSLTQEMLPAPDSFRLSRALELRLDFGQREISTTFSAAERREILRAMELDAPLTLEWRIAVLRSVMQDRVIPILGRIEKGEITKGDHLDIWRAKVNRWVPECRRLRRKGRSDSEIVDFLFEQGVPPGLVYFIFETAFGVLLSADDADRIDEKWAHGNR